MAQNIVKDGRKTEGVSTINRTESLFRTLFDASPDGIFIVDSQGFVDCNPAVLTMFRVANKSELLGLMPDAISPEFQPDGSSSKLVAMQKVQMALMEGECPTFLWWHQTLDGRYVFPTEVVLRRIEFDDQVLLQGIVRDISDRYRAEKHLQNFFSQSLHLHLIASIEGVMLQLNPGWQTLLGYSPEELQGQSFFNLVHSDDLTATLTEMKRLDQGYKTLYFVNRYRHKNGSYRTIAWSATADIDDHSIFAIGTDITEQKKIEEDLRNSEAEFHQIFDNVTEAIFVHDAATGDIIKTNNVVEEMYGYTPEEVRSLAVSELSSNVPPYTQEEANALLGRALAGEEVKFQWHAKHKDGHLLWTEAQMRCAEIAGRDCILVIARDITARKATEKQMKILLQAVEQSPVSVVITDLHARIEYVNSNFEEISGYSADQVVGRNASLLKSGLTPVSYYQQLWQLLLSGQAWKGEFQNRRQDGSLYWERVQIAPVQDDQGQVHHYLAVKEDITELKAQQDKILHQAHYDSLTQLPNRFLCLDRLGQQIKEAERNDHSIAVLFLDLDDFKRVNDSLGHDAGDSLLISAAARLQSVVRGTDTVGRLGGDEFIVLLSDLSDINIAAQIAEQILLLFQQPFTMDKREIVTTTSIGIACFPSDGKDSAELLRNADTAMYAAKQEGRNVFQFYTEAMNLQVARQLQLEELLYNALERDEFEVHYQPVLHIGSREITSAEALLRWHPSGIGPVYPDEFIPILEKTGGIIQVGNFVLEQSLKMAASIKAESLPGFHIAVNISPRQLRNADFPEYLFKLLKQYKFPATSLTLEITEGVLMTGYSIIEAAIKQLISKGVHIAMDDFGTGYSSLSYLRNYPFHALKIDRSFIRDITHDKADLELVNAAIAMAHSLELVVVAEGVETEQQLDLLALKACDYAQGFLFSKAVPKQAFFSLMSSKTERS
ncbi:sensor domain-containing protein [Amphritea balenae]|nr:PAS domain S-box protein [Amphritea balenae]GGK60380.1 hypothetical protein GCM10007941_08290 [Amphritea balenae]